MIGAILREVMAAARARLGWNGRGMRVTAHDPGDEDPCR